ncbi:unnamed protein product [Lepeophtheirus salmonis]|uniref:(salmon louse) hypothetical protein n=1 Tax=Lepeophtheirus salmonis TaxID=72036 RepID=A0A7R8CQD0_LEPSM|nr:unnamed protein product [Lepeophtheirus salmonis]CAF2858511.1 unnamed protein product [Lepeophtheirus salmonis]
MTNKNFFCNLDVKPNQSYSTCPDEFSNASFLSNPTRMELLMSRAQTLVEGSNELNKTKWILPNSHSERPHVTGWVATMAAIVDHHYHHRRRGDEEAEEACMMKELQSEIHAELEEQMKEFRRRSKSTTSSSKSPDKRKRRKSSHSSPPPAPRHSSSSHERRSRSNTGKGKVIFIKAKLFKPIGNIMITNFRNRHYQVPLPTLGNIYSSKYPNPVIPILQQQQQQQYHYQVIVIRRKTDMMPIPKEEMDRGRYSTDLSSSTPGGSKKENPCSTGVLATQSRIWGTLKNCQSQSKKLARYDHIPSQSTPGSSLHRHHHHGGHHQAIDDEEEEDARLREQKKDFQKGWKRRRESQRRLMDKERQKEREELERKVDQDQREKERQIEIERENEQELREIFNLKQQEEFERHQQEERDKKTRPQGLRDSESARVDIGSESTCQKESETPLKPAIKMEKQDSSLPDQSDGGEAEPFPKRSCLKRRWLEKEKVALEMADKQRRAERERKKTGHRRSKSGDYNLEAEHRTYEDTSKEKKISSQKLPEEASTADSSPPCTCDDSDSNNQQTVLEMPIPLVDKVVFLIRAKVKAMRLLGSSAAAYIEGLTEDSDDWDDDPSATSSK